MLVKELVSNGFRFGRKCLKIIHTGVGSCLKLLVSYGGVNKEKGELRAGRSEPRQIRRHRINSAIHQGAEDLQWM